MPIEGTTLPDDPEALRALIAAQAAELAAARAGLVAKALEIETLKLQIARLRRQAFGRSSEKLGQVIGQLELSLEELEQTRRRRANAQTSRLPRRRAAAATSEVKRRRGRRPLPEHLHRCGACTVVRLSGLRRGNAQGGRGYHRDAGRFEVIRHVRPTFSCRRCETMAQAPMPSLPIDRGRPGPGLLAHVLISKYCDHLPLYRQAQIYAREDVDLDRGRWPTGSARRPGCCARSSTRSPPMSWLPKSCTPTIRRSLCSTPVAAAPGPAVMGLPA